MPVTNDFVPVFPWFGLALSGVALARAAQPWAIRAGLPEWRAKGVLFRALAWSGRRSLPIYLTHQPILLGALFLVAQIAGSDPAADSAPFLAHCRTTCREADKAESLCRAACVCVVERLIAESLWRDAVASRLTPRDQARIGPMAQRCFEEVEPALRDPHSPDVDPSETQP
jgi:uncharacterized membrane protein